MLSLLDNLNAQDVNLTVIIKIIFTFNSQMMIVQIIASQMVINQSYISGSLQRSFICAYKKYPSQLQKAYGNGSQSVLPVKLYPNPTESENLAVGPCEINVMHIENQWSQDNNNPFLLFSQFPFVFTTRTVAW